MSFLVVGIAAVSGATKIAMALSGRKKRIQEQKSANAELQMRRDAYESLDTSNPYLNMENTMEDLTVNTQQADLQQEASKIQGLERRGDVYSRNLKKDKAETLFGMSMQRSKESDEARQRAGQQIASGVGDLASAGIGAGQAGAFGSKAQTFFQGPQ